MVAAAACLLKKENGFGNLDDDCSGEPRAVGRGGSGGFEALKGFGGRGRAGVYAGMVNVG
jgi:hypothetical protein